MFAQLADQRPGKDLVLVNDAGPSWLDGDARRVSKIQQALARMTAAPMPPATPKPPTKWTVKSEFVELDEGCPVLFVTIRSKKRFRILIDRAQPNWPVALQVAVERYRQDTPVAAMNVLDDTVHDILTEHAPRPTYGCTPAYGYTRTLRWCTTLHADGDHPDDRIHCGDSVTVDLSLEPGETASDGTFWPARAAAYLRQHDRDAAPVIEIGREDTRGMEMTVDEALAFATQILCLVATAREAEHAQDRA